MRNLLTLRLRPPLDPQGKPPRDVPLEGLRGLCALLVLYAHFFVPNPVLDPSWVPSPRFWWLNFGYAAVLMFFVLSGYVIGIVTRQPATTENIRRYIRRRALRIMPMTFIAVLIAWAFSPGLQLRTIVGHFLFLQNSEPYPGLGLFPLLANNPNLWSLNYELVYYLAFIAVWRFKPSLLGFGLGLGLLVAARSVDLPIAAVFGRYACGGFYWLAGLTVAWLSPPAPTSSLKSCWPAALLGASAMWTIAPLRSFLQHGEQYGWLWTTPVSPHRLDFLPACLWVLLTITGRAPGTSRGLGILCLAWSTLGLTFHGLNGSWSELDTVAAVTLLAAGVLLRTPCSTTPMNRLAPVGAISFGIYVVAAPIQLQQRAVFSSFSGSSLTFGVRAVLTVAIVIGAAWALERVFQPVLANKWREKTPN